MSKHLSYRHRGATTPLIGLTVDAHLQTVVERFPDHDALVGLPQRRRFSYRELDQEVQRLAKALIALGVEHGDRVGIWSTNNVEWVLMQLATARVGAVLVNVNPAYRIAELKHALRLARVNLLFTIPSFRSSNYVGMINELCPQATKSPPESFECQGLPHLRQLAVWDPADPLHSQRPASAFHTWQDVLSLAEGVSDEQVAERSAQLDMDDPINIQFTSGTTGFPKAVVLTHHNILNNGFFIGQQLRFSEHDRLCVPVPFYHCFGMVVSNLACLTHGACIVIPAEHFDAAATLEALSRERCSALHGVPTMFVACLEELHRGDYRVDGLRTGIMAGAPCPPELARRVIEELGMREFMIAYGQTEAAPVTHLTAHDDSFERRVGSVGRTMPHQESKVVDTSTDAVLPCGGQGEVCVRGYNVMRGYFDNPEATRQTIDERGWLHTGDLGVMDEEGYLKITGRLKDMVIRGGENIYPAEIEAFFFEHPMISEVAVFGVPDPRLGEELCMWVQLHPGQQVSPEQLREWGKGRIAHYKVPRHVWIVEEFPMTVTGKIQKFKMRDVAADWLRESHSSE